MANILDNILSKLDISFGKALVVASVPFVGYLFSYNFESGYIEYFNVPSYFIELSLTHIVIATTVLASSLIILFTLLNGFFPILKALYVNSKFSRYILRAIILTSLSAFPLFSSKTQILDKFVIVLFTLIVYILLFIGLPYIFYPHGGSLEERLQKDLEHSRNTEEFLDLIVKYPIIITAFLYIVFVFMLSTTIHSIGKYAASIQSEFLVSDSNPKYALVRRYGDYWIEVEIKDNKLSEVLKITKDTEQNFIKQKLSVEIGQDKSITIKVINQIGQFIVKTFGIIGRFCSSSVFSVSNFFFR